MATQASQIDGAKAAESLLLRFPQITAAVCYQDIVALGVMQALRKMGREPGRDFALVGFDDITEAALVQPALTTVSVAAKRLVARLGSCFTVAFREMTNHRNVLFCRLRWWSENHVVLADRHAFY